MKTLFDAIYNKFVADGKYGLTALYNTEADSEAVFPYAVFSIVSAVSESGDFSNDWENCLIQFNLFDSDPKCTDINAACKALKTAFHKFDLVVVDSDTISLTKEAANLLHIEGVWQWNISFRILLGE